MTIVIIRIMMVLLLAATLHLYYNIPNKGASDKSIGLFIWVYLIHNSLYPIIVLLFGEQYNYIETAAPILLLYGPILYSSYRANIKSPIPTRKKLLHFIPFVVVFIFYLYFVLNSDFRNNHSFLYYRIVLSIQGVVIGIYSFYLLFLTRKKADSLLMINWYLLAVGIVTMITAQNMPENKPDEIINSSSKMLFIMVILIFMALGIVILYLHTLSRYKKKMLSFYYIDKTSRTGTSTLPNSNENENETRESKQNINSLNKRIERIVFLYIKNKVDINQKELAAALHITQAKLLEAINEHYGATFSQFVIKERIKYACSLLRDEDYHFSSFEFVASESGFGSIAAFYRNFKLQTGVTPKEYRDSYIMNNKKHTT